MGAIRVSTFDLCCDSGLRKARDLLVVGGEGEGGEVDTKVAVNFAAAVGAGGTGCYEVGGELSPFPPFPLPSNP